MSRRAGVAAAAGLYLLWTGATYLLEGGPETFLRPEAGWMRLTYALVANVLVGTVASVWLAGRFVEAGVGSARELGFGGPRRASLSVGAALLLGFASYLLQDPPTLDPVVLLNGYAQVLVVSVAEVLVCWALVGGSVGAALRARGTAVRSGALLGVSAAAFGAYHFAHSPPFDSPGMVLFLSGIGLVTGTYFLVSRDVYGTIAFHNFLGVLGVLRALEEAGGLEAFAAPRWPLLATATLAVAVLVVLHRRWIGGGRWAPGPGPPEAP